MSKAELKSFILNYCDTAYGTPPTGCLNAFDRFGLTQAEITWRCERAGSEPGVAFASLDELRSEGYLIGHPLGEGDVKFWRGQAWVNYRASTYQSVPSFQG